VFLVELLCFFIFCGELMYGVGGVGRG